MVKLRKIKTSNIYLQILTVVIFLIFLLLIPSNERITVVLKDCVDGDTAKFITSKGIETVRFLAVDTPESVHPTKEDEPYGEEASSFTCNELKKAKKISLELDINSDRYDKYDRLLAWIFVDDDLLQDKLVINGLAKVTYLYGDYKYTDILLMSEAKAKAKKIGIWYNE